MLTYTDLHILLEEFLQDYMIVSFTNGNTRFTEFLPKGEIFTDEVDKKKFYRELQEK